jgi:uncharacterized membrane protein
VIQIKTRAQEMSHLVSPGLTDLEIEAMLKKTTIAVTAAALMLGAASTAQASKDDSGDYKGGSLFGPMPGQVFNYGRAPGGYYGGAYGYAYAPRGGRALGYAPSLRAEYPTAPWEEY